MCRSALIALTSLALCSCVVEVGDGQIVTVQRTVGAFTRVSVANGIHASITRGDRSVRVTTDGNLQRFVSARVEGETLVLETISNFALSPTGHVIAEVTNDVVEGMDVSGGSKVSADATSAAQWPLHVSGGSTVAVSRLDTQQLSLTASGGSHVDAFGIATAASITASGGSQVDTDGVSAEVVTVDGSGGSTLHVRASKTAQGSVSGGSHASVSGNPGTRSIGTSGGSTVTYVNE